MPRCKKMMAAALLGTMTLLTWPMGPLAQAESTTASRR